ncbi:hypothetical protein [Nonomuraea cavernae]|uniref:hypothetical protein n=1 Tax=Nonomuraea cavernae TaxID=2045107 RepID=UPI00340F475C
MTWCEMPDIRHQRAGNAATELRAVGFVIGQQRFVADHICNDIGTILRQSPNTWPHQP